MKLSWDFRLFLTDEAPQFAHTMSQVASEVVSVNDSLPQDQEVVVKTFFGYSYQLGSLYQAPWLFFVKCSPQFRHHNDLWDVSVRLSGSFCRWFALLPLSFLCWYLSFWALAFAFRFDVLFFHWLTVWAFIAFLLFKPSFQSLIFYLSLQVKQAIFDLIICLFLGWRRQRF